MTLETHKRDWEDLAKVDPLWAIYSDPKQRYGKWDRSAFYATGEADVDHVISICRRLGRPVEWGSALDFGCGMGRLTRAMSKYFERCVGVDISQEMVSQASLANPACEFIVNTDTSLPFSNASFDFIYTKYVLQHLPTRNDMRAYVREFSRVLKPNGLLVFQIRTGLSFKASVQAGRRIYSFLRTVGLTERFIYLRLRLNPIRVITMSEAEMAPFLRQLNVRILEEERYRVSSGTGITYYVSK
jgi:SAM-dependent methyltransferase